VRLIGSRCSGTEAVHRHVEMASSPSATRGDSVSVRISSPYTVGQMIHATLRSQEVTAASLRPRLQRSVNRSPAGGVGLSR
jgi:hypothetical protein